MTLVAAPEVPFEDLDRALTELNWFLASESQEPPLIPGEPELATYTHRQADARITYTFNPAVKLRVLAFEGRDAAVQERRVAQRIALVDEPRLRRLLASTEIRDLQLGLLAAGARREWRVVGEVERLKDHPEPGVARTAARVLTQLRSLLLAEAVNVVLTEPVPPPDPATLFRAMGNAQARRQVLRMLLHDGQPMNPTREAMLRAALDDDDDEVRITARLVGEGLRQGGGATVPPPADDRTLLTYALTTPLLPTPPPPSPPAGVRADGPDSYRLAGADLELCWVAPVSHWLGQGPTIRPVPSPGFFVTREPLSTSAAEWALGPDGGAPPKATGKAARTYLATRDQARAIATALGRTAGATVVLPSPDQWEMAARGPDGRRFPWGNREDLEQKTLPSPWGCERMVGGPPEWTTDDVVCGGPRLIPCAARRPVADVTHAAVRLVVPGMPPSQRSN